MDNLHLHIVRFTFDSVFTRSVDSHFSSIVDSSVNINKLTERLCFRVLDFETDHIQFINHLDLSGRYIFIFELGIVFNQII